MYNGWNGVIVTRKSTTKFTSQFEPLLLKFCTHDRNSLTKLSTSMVVASDKTTGDVRKRAVVCWISPSAVVRWNCTSMVAYHFMHVCLCIALFSCSLMSSTLFIMNCSTSTSLGPVEKRWLSTAPFRANRPKQHPAQQRNNIFVVGYCTMLAIFWLYGICIMTTQHHKDADDHRRVWGEKNYRVCT